VISYGTLISRSTYNFDNSTKFKDMSDMAMLVVSKTTNSNPIISYHIYNKIIFMDRPLSYNDPNAGMILALLRTSSTYAFEERSTRPLYGRPFSEKMEYILYSQSNLAEKLEWLEITSAPPDLMMNSPYFMETFPAPGPFAPLGRSSEPSPTRKLYIVDINSRKFINNPLEMVRISNYNDSTSITLYGENIEHIIPVKRLNSINPNEIDLRTLVVVKLEADKVDKLMSYGYFKTVTLQ
jgi:hypothetical protein